MGPDQVSSVFVEGGEVGCGGGEARGRHHYKNDMPQGSSDRARRGTLRSTQHSLKKLPSESSWDTGPGQDGYDAAAIPGGRSPKRRRAWGLGLFRGGRERQTLWPVPID